VDLVNSLLLFYSLPNTSQTTQTTKSNKNTNILPHHAPPPIATKPTLTKAQSVSELITLYETGGINSATPLSSGVALPQTKLVGSENTSGVNMNEPINIESTSNNSDTNDDNSTTDSVYKHLTPFASFDLFTMLHPHTTTDSYINNTYMYNTTPPQTQQISHVSVLNHSILIFSSEFSANCANGVVEKITIVKIGS
jgi:hypothetical protein